jgi:hypothetical protein
MNDKKLLDIAKRILELAKNTPEVLESTELSKMDPSKKYLRIRQDWNTEYKQGGKHYKLPFNTLTHINQLPQIDAHHQGKKVWQESSTPDKKWGEETYEMLPEGSLKLVGANYDTSG